MTKVADHAFQCSSV